MRPGTRHMMALLMPADSLGPGHLFNKYGEPVRAG